jgi:predicted 3-demethylubiquinone-9 3-methyltransferase (glyoxalase superfamily)
MTLSGTETPKVRTCFWFARGGIDAARFYVGLLPDSRIEAVHDHGQPDDPMVVEFSLAGAPMMILTAGPMFELSPAASISVLTDDQAETDRLWSALLADGGRESMCGWLTDRFGVSWQILPNVLPSLLDHPDAAGAARARSAMMQMRKIDVAALEAAFHADAAA